MKWDICLTVLTTAQEDLFKLAMLDVSNEVSPGFSNHRYHDHKPGYLRWLAWREKMPHGPPPPPMLPEGKR